MSESEVKAIYDTILVTLPASDLVRSLTTPKLIGVAVYAHRQLESGHTPASEVIRSLWLTREQRSRVRAIMRTQDRTGGKK